MTVRQSYKNQPAQQSMFEKNFDTINITTDLLVSYKKCNIQGSFLYKRSEFYQKRL